MVELQPVLPIPADQRWLWSARWRSMERAVDVHINAGRVTTLDSVEALFERLDRPQPG